MVQADSRGEYRAGRLEPGTYLVLANKANGIARWTWQSNYRITYYPAALDQASAQPLNIEAGQQVRADIRILKQSGVSVSGQLLGLPASKSLYTRMALKPVNSNAVNPDSPFTSAEKDFAFTDVLPGRYTLYAQTEDAMSDPVNPNRKPLFGLVKDVEIGSQDLAGFDLTLQPMKTLTGQVEVAGNCALPAYVQLQGSTPLGFGQVEGPIASDGTFELTKVPAGRYNKVMVSRTENPLGPMSVVSAIKGSRDVVKEGLESPWQEDQILKIRVACSDQGVRQ
jgi:hypothetical protein